MSSRSNGERHNDEKHEQNWDHSVSSYVRQILGNLLVANSAHEKAMITFKWTQYV